MHHQRAFLDFAGDQAAGEAGLEVALKETLERTRAEDRVVALLRHPFFRLRIERDRHAAVGKAVVDVGEEQVDDALDFLPRDRG